MKVGDAVRRKWVTDASRRRFENMNRGNPEEIGIIVEVSDEMVKVVFPSSGEMFPFLKNRLEIISESR